MHFCMVRAQNRARLCSERRTISRARFASPAVKYFEAPTPMASDAVAPAAESAAANGHGEAHSTARFTALLIGSIGVVYGDIGTSPLYAFREAVVAASGSAGAVTPQAVLGVLSLIVWALIIVVTLKYVVILLRADNNGEGGTLALMALAQRAVGHGAGTIVLLGIISGALFYGDAVITPALSVLSAIEGIKLVTETFEPYVVPLTVLILAALFAAQSRGTARVAAFFGPVMCIWFAVIAIAAIPSIVRHPEVLLALNPLHAVSFMLHHGIIGFVTLGAVFLAVTGAEALYADLGHFGKRPIQTAWLFIVLPSLALNYLGQGALVIADPKAVENPFFLMYPDWALIPMVVLATVATVIASQAVITGAYSLTRQAIQLGLLPRFEIRHTSESHSGQIYIPRINMLLFISVIFLVLMFRSSSALASAYGIAVTGTMVVTAMMGFVVIWKVWRWSPFAAAALIAPFLFLDLTFLAANLLKVFEGGWVPLALGAVIMLLMYTWRRGSRLLFEKSRKLEFPLLDLVAMLEKRPPQRVSGTAVFLTSDPVSAPTPRIDPAERVKLEQISATFSKVTLRFGFMESPNVPKALAIARKLGWQFDIMSTSFFLSRRALKPAAHSGMPRWQDHLFIALSRTANDATDYFQIPSGRVVEVGTQVTV